jgi:hypothetical protein
MVTPPLTFIESTHQFWRGGQLVPSVTQVIKAAGLVDTTWQSDWARDRGVRVHTALQVLVQRDEDAALQHLQEDDLPFFAAGQRWLETAGVEVLGAEELIDGGSYAGWLDLRCKVRGFDRPVVVDFKTGSLPAWVGLQLAAYAAPLTVAGGHDRMAVRLQLGGEPRVHVYRAASDWADFRACLKVWQIQERMGVWRE